MLVSFVTTTTLIVLALYCIKLVTAWRKSKQRLSHIPGLDQYLAPELIQFLPKFVHQLFTLVNLFDCETVNELREKFGSVFKCNFQMYSAVFIDDADFLKLAIREEGKVLTKRGDAMMEALKTVIGQNILTTSDMQEWGRHRIVLNPVFAENNLECVRDATVKVCKTWFEQIDQQSSRNIRYDVGAVSVDVLGHASFKYEFNAIQSDNKSGLVASIQTLLQNVFQYAFLSPFSRVVFPAKWVSETKGALDMINSHVSSMIQHRRSINHSHGSSHRDLLSQMMGSNLTDQELISDTIIFMIAGHDTTSSTLTFVFYLLAKFQAVQLSAQQYLDKVLSGRDPRFEDVMHLDYIANILKEAMRMYPAVSFLIRIAQKSFEWKGYKIPKGSNVVIPVLRHMRNSLFFENPDEFNPDRWSEQKSRKEYIPFGYGKRSCIGKRFAEIEMITIITMVLQRYSLSMDTNYGSMKTNCIFTEMPQRDVIIHFKQRRNLS